MKMWCHRLVYLSAVIVGVFVADVSAARSSQFVIKLLPNGGAKQEEKAATRFSGPASFWGLYDSALNRASVDYGAAYPRQNPYNWRRNPTFGYSDVKPSDILVLGTRTKLSHGPRGLIRRSLRSNTLEKTSRTFQEIFNLPLFCSRLLVNCRLFPHHLCCPDRRRKRRRKKKNKEMRDKSARKKRSQDIVDPIFGIPISKRRISSESGEALLVLSTEAPEQTKIQTSDGYGGKWRPYPWRRLPQRRCGLAVADPVRFCRRYRHHACCGVAYPYIDRMVPIGPFVQPSLLENWVSAVFEFGGRDPEGYAAVRQTLLVTSLGVAALLWGYVGAQLGLVKIFGKKRQDATDRSDDDIPAALTLDAEDPDWIQQLERRAASSSFDSYRGVRDFFCCVDNDSSKLKCFPNKKKYIHKLSPKVDAEKAFNCQNGLSYNVTLDEQQEDV